LTYARKNKKMGFIDLNGNWVIEPKYEKVRAFSKSLAPVLEGKKWGYINTKGEFVVQPMYDDAEVFSADGLAAVKSKDWGFVDTSGKLVIPTNYQITAVGLSMFNSEDKGFVNGLARVKANKKWCFLKPDGSILGNQYFDNAELFQK
ncbi:MAG: hypothetical protein CVU07_10675, partial [Bacteroidetes bacterium HGW-Bacteroidetes-23]